MKQLLQKFSKFRIPTLLGISLIFAGIFAGVFLILKDQPFFAKADIDINPEPTITNILSDSATISFKTEVPIPAFINYGITSTDEKETRDDRDVDKPPTPRQIHYFTIKNLQPDTNYQYKITAGKSISEILTFKTAKVESLQNGFSPVIGTVLSGNAPLKEGVAYLAMTDSVTQSALIKNNGTFLIPLSFVRKNDLSDVLLPKDLTPAKLTIVSTEGEAVVLFPLKPSDNTLNLIKLGDNLDLTNTDKLLKPLASPTSTINFDLNEDGQVNTADNAIILKNFGKNPANKKADLAGPKGVPDGIVDNLDLKLMSEKISGQNTR